MISSWILRVFFSFSNPLSSNLLIVRDDVLLHKFYYFLTTLVRVCGLYSALLLISSSCRWSAHIRLLGTCLRHCITCLGIRRTTLIWYWGKLLSVMWSYLLFHHSRWRHFTFPTYCALTIFIKSSWIMLLMFVSWGGWFNWGSFFSANVRVCFNTFLDRVSSSRLQSRLSDICMWWGFCHFEAICMGTITNCTHWQDKNENYFNRRPRKMLLLRIPYLTCGLMVAKVIYAIDGLGIHRCYWGDLKI